MRIRVSREGEGEEVLVSYCFVETREGKAVPKREDWKNVEWR